MPCTHNGITYPSLQACADALGLARHTLSHHLRKHGHLEGAGKGKCGRPKGSAGPKRETRIGPMTWDSRAAAADLGIHPAALSRALSKTRALPGDYEKLVTLVMQLHIARQKARSGDGRPTAAVLRPVRSLTTG